jgi:hypothetical protein
VGDPETFVRTFLSKYKLDLSTAQTIDYSRAVLFAIEAALQFFAANGSGARCHCLVAILIEALDHNYILDL